MTAEASGKGDQKIVDLPGNELFVAAIAALNATVMVMHSKEWIEFLRTQPQDVVDQAEESKFKLMNMQTLLWTALLEKLVKALAKHSAALKSATKKVNQAHKDLEDVKKVLGAVSKFLEVMGKVMELAIPA